MHALLTVVGGVHPVPLPGKQFDEQRAQRAVVLDHQQRRREVWRGTPSEGATKSPVPPRKAVLTGSKNVPHHCFHDGTPSSDVGGAALADSEWTRWTTGMHLLVTDPTVLSRARAIVDAELDAIEDAASRFRPDSEICALAAAAGARTP